MESTTATDAPPAFQAAMAEQMATIAAELSGWALAAPRTLAEVEQRALTAARELGNALLAGVCGVLAAPSPEPERPCACGHAARYLRQRPATVRTVLGPAAIARAYYYCPAAATATRRSTGSWATARAAPARGWTRCSPCWGPRPTPSRRRSRCWAS